MRRKFKIGDRVKCWYHDKWWSGTIIEFPKRRIKLARSFFELLTKGLSVNIIAKDDEFVIYEHPTFKTMLVKTDEKVDNSPDVLLGGYGLTGSLNGPFTVFENDPEPNTSDSIFRNR